MRTSSRATLALACCWLAGAHGQEKEREPQREQAPAPDLDFLEYLGAWAEGDDEWLAIEEWRKDLSADAKDPRGAENAKGVEDAKESETVRDDDHENE